MFTLCFCLLSRNLCIILDSLKVRNYPNTTYFLKSYLNDAMSKSMKSNAFACLCNWYSSKRTMWNLLNMLRLSSAQNVRTRSFYLIINQFMHYGKCYIVFIVKHSIHSCIKNNIEIWARGKHFIQTYLTLVNKNNLKVMICNMKITF